MLRDAAARRAGVLTRVGLDTFVDPRRQGAKMNAAAREDVVRVVEFGGEEWLHFRNHCPMSPSCAARAPIRTATSRWSTRGASLGALGGRARDAQLRRRGDRVSSASCRAARSTRSGAVPSTMVDYVVVDPEQVQATHGLRPGTFRRGAQAARGVRAGALRSGQGHRRGAALERARRRRQPRLRHLAAGAAHPARGGLRRRGDLGDRAGPVGGIPAAGFVFGCAFNAQAIIPSPAQFTYFQGAGFDVHALVPRDRSRGVGQRVAPSARPHVTAGCGGFIDITAHAKRIVFRLFAGVQLAWRHQLRILKEGKVAKLVPEVEHVTFSGRRAGRRGQRVTIVTERCVLKLEAGARGRRDRTRRRSRARCCRRPASRSWSRRI